VNKLLTPSLLILRVKYDIFIEFMKASASYSFNTIWRQNTSPRMKNQRMLLETSSDTIMDTRLLYSLSVSTDVSSTVINVPIRRGLNPISLDILLPSTQRRPFADFLSSRTGESEPFWDQFEKLLSKFPPHDTIDDEIDRGVDEDWQTGDYSNLRHVLLLIPVKGNNVELEESVVESNSPTH